MLWMPYSLTLQFMAASARIWADRLDGLNAAVKPHPAKNEEKPKAPVIDLTQWKKTHPQL